VRRGRTKQRSASLRLLQYLRPYRGHLILTAALMVGFAATSGISIRDDLPVREDPLHAAAQRSDSGPLPAPIAAVTGLDMTGHASRGRAADEAADTKGRDPGAE
jgi:hypothetical protein